MKTNAMCIAKIPVWEKCNALLYDSWWNSEITLDIPNTLFVISFHCTLNRLVEIVFTFFNPEWQVGIVSCFEWHVILSVSSHCSMPWHLILSISSRWSMPWHVILSFFSSLWSMPWHVTADRTFWTSLSVAELSFVVGKWNKEPVTKSIRYI